MKSDLVIYEKPTCSKCRAAVHLLDESGRPYRRVRYYEKHLSAKKILELIQKSKLPPREFVRTDEPAWKKLKKKVEDLSAREIANIISKNPDLIQRPILECGDQATVGRPTERAAAFIAACSS